MTNPDVAYHPEDDIETLMVAILDGTDLAKHGQKVAAGLVRFYKYTTPPARELVAKAYPWLVELMTASDKFGEFWTTERVGTQTLVVPKDPSRPLSLHPSITSRFTDQFTGGTISGLQMLLAIALTVNPDLDTAIKVAVQSGGPLSVQPKTIRLVTMPGARKSHGMGVYMLRFNTKGSVVIGSAVTSTFKERLDLPFYSMSANVRDAASWIDQRRDRDDFILFDLACYSDSIPQLDWLTLALKSLCVLMFETTAASRGLNAGIAVAAGDTVARVKEFWDVVLRATRSGAQIFPYVPDEAGPETFADFYTAYLAELDKRGNMANCYELLVTMSRLADTCDYDAFPPLPEGAFGKDRPAPRGLVGDTPPLLPPSVGNGLHVHHPKNRNGVSPSRRRGVSPASMHRLLSNLKAKVEVEPRDGDKVKVKAE